MNLLKNTKFTVFYKGTTGETSGTAGVIQSTEFADMSGWDGILLIGGVNATSATATTGIIHLYPQMSTAASTSLLTALAATARPGTTGAFSTGDIGTLLLCDIYKPTERYVSAKYYIESTGVMGLMPIIGIQYNGHKGAVTQSTSFVFDSKQCISPTT